MTKISKLSAGMINKIAAGEVIERPASVVKELVENSLDAGATRIEVQVERSGSEVIRIIDNGCGIDSADMLLAVEPHATSKVSELDDLFKIQTFGFRGEALASVAEISQFALRSRRPQASDGAEIRSDGGTLTGPVPCGTAPGTTIEIRNLFFNVPVRRKYLKSETTEFGHISEAFIRLALPQIETNMILKHNNRVVHQLAAVSTFRQRVSAFLGAATAEKLIDVHWEREHFKIHGCVGHPDLSRNNASFQYFFLNRRYIKDRALQHALTEAYRGLLTSGRYPVAFLQIEIPPDQFDINVHPTKLEVRFLNSHAIYSGFLGAIREQLLQADLKSHPKAEDLSKNRSFAERNCFSPASGSAERSSGRGGMKKVASFVDPGACDPQGAIDPTLLEEQHRQILEWAKNDMCQAGNLDASGSSVFGPGSNSDPESTRNIEDSGQPRSDAAAFGNFQEISQAEQDPLAVSKRSNKETAQQNIPGDKDKTPPFIPYPNSHSSLGNFLSSERNPALQYLSATHDTPLQKPEIRPRKSQNTETQDPESKSGETQYFDENSKKNSLVEGASSFPRNSCEADAFCLKNQENLFDQENQGCLKSSENLDDKNNLDFSNCQNSLPFPECGFSQDAVAGECGARSAQKRSKNDPNASYLSTGRFDVACSPAGKPVIQIHQRYLVMETEEGLALIDQHALHERILYEKISQKLTKGSLDVQRLLIPEAVDLAPEECAAVLEHQAILANFGLLVDSFGGNTVVINGYPAILRHVLPQEILETLMQPLLNFEKTPNRNDLLDSMMHQMACKAAVKAGNLIRSEAIGELLIQAENEIHSHHCPHGRPSILIFSCQDIDKLFKRIL